ncbi:TrbC/VirB2 family protein [Succinimonas amylolytica]|uniref:TrbC/VirB2 family protein n=1 Tax=Succinimonas amylolytica TaxID=83769 RepID=UPI0023A89064
MNLKTLMLFALALAVSGFADPAFATDLPWEDGLKTVKESLTGPVATALAIIGMVGAGAMLIFGGEISGFLKSVCYMVLVVAFLISGSSLLEVFTGKKDNATGAVITYVVPDHHVIALS